MLPEQRAKRQLEEENGKLKKIVADLSLDKAMLQDVAAFLQAMGELQSRGQLAQPADAGAEHAGAIRGGTRGGGLAAQVREVRCRIDDMRQQFAMPIAAIHAALEEAFEVAGWVLSDHYHNPCENRHARF